MAMVELTMNEYQALIDRAKNAEDRAAALAQEVEVQRISSADEVPGLLAAITAAMPIIRYALAHLPPEAHRDWPAAALRAFSVAFEGRPGATIDDRSFAIDARSFADHVDRLEAMRRQRDRDERDALPTENRLPTPDSMG
jgi:hypothetical protein